MMVILLLVTAERTSVPSGARTLMAAPEMGGLGWRRPGEEMLGGVLGTVDLEVVSLWAGLICPTWTLKAGPPHPGNHTLLRMEVWGSHPRRAGVLLEV